MSNAEWSARDLRHVWHPCTQMKDHPQLPMIPIRSGSGVWLEDFDGNRYLDAVSSWWVNLFGHANPEISARVAEQAAKLEHVLLAGFTHQPVIELSERLAKITPDGLERCFYADNGSSAVEIALKMSFHYWKNLGRSRKTRFVSLTNSYHGETLGALSVGDVELYRDTYAPLLLEPIIVDGADSWHCPEGQDLEAWSVEQFEVMERTLADRHEEICAVIVEPLVQCAGSMRMYHPAWLKRLRQACDRYQVHLIADEIAVGFGRTGTLFACEQADIAPDMLCLSKGLTGGYLPLSVVVTTDTVYDAFYDDYESLKAFLHSHSYTGNALACSAALATLDQFESRNVLSDNARLATEMATAVEQLRDHPHVGDIRQRGMILAIEMVKDRATRSAYPWQERRGLHVYRHGLDNAVLLRPLGNVVYFMPPYVINSGEISLMARTAIEGIDKATLD